MKRLIIILPLFIFLSLNLNAQCKGGCPDRTLSSQMAIDTFSATTLKDLTISGSDITNLEGLSSLTSLEGNLDLTNVPELTDLKGLENLTRVDGYLDVFRSKISDVDALNNLVSVRELSIEDNAQLTDLSGLNNLRTAGEIYIGDNGGIENLTGLQNLESITSVLTIAGEDQLQNLNALSNVQSIETLFIIDNLVLNSCTGLCPSLNTGGINNVALFEFNGDFGGECDDYTVLEENCSALLLPVELISFEIQPKNENQVHLEWRTAAEFENSGFKVERSVDLKSFTEVSFVPAKGVGTYEFTDESAPMGQNYYRLVQVDLDGTESPSMVRSVFLGSNDIKLYPTVAEHILHIETENDLSGIDIFDQHGAKVKTFTGRKALLISDLPSGWYSAHINGENQSSIHRFFRK